LLAIVGGIWFLVTTRSNADGTWYKTVYGYAKHSGTALQNHDIDAKDTYSHPSWTIVDQTDENGYYNWTPGSGWDHGYITMRVHPTCNGAPPPQAVVDYLDTPQWGHDPNSLFSTRVDVNAQDCSSR
jgi:hypothetical protein